LHPPSNKKKGREIITKLNLKFKKKSPSIILAITGTKWDRLAKFQSTSERLKRGERSLPRIQGLDERDALAASTLFNAIRKKREEESASFEGRGRGNTTLKK